VEVTPRGERIVDVSPFLTADTLDLAGRFNELGKGFKALPALSVADPASLKAFPDNIEIDSLLSFASDTPGKEVEAIAVTPKQLSLSVHHSFIRLPGPGYQPRRFDIRVGGFSSQSFDFGVPLGEAVVTQLANRFRLEKVDPAAARSRVKKPIIFYIDSAAPEPIRTALLTGAGWWSQAFDAAGLIDAFQVKVLPEGADPLDVRYNVVNWNHRLSRGWSFGQVVVDPRTGEIVKGSVLLESRRLRQDMILFEGLVGTANNGNGGANDPVRLSLARVAQLAAHEVGHALGFVHNFASSTQADADHIQSVMDYPGPKIGLRNGEIDLADAYTTGIGAWDKFTVDWLYADPAGENAEAAADGKVRKVYGEGARFITDVDGRAVETANAWGSMWDNGADPSTELRHILDVRAVALGRFGEGALRPGEPIAELRRKFVPLWLLHRYQVEATAKLVGGIDYRYGAAGDGLGPSKAVSPASQRAALDALLATLSTSALTVPAHLPDLLTSGLNGREDPQFSREVFSSEHIALFDPLAATESAAQLTLSSLLAAPRLNRVYRQHVQDASQPGLDTLFERLLAATTGNLDTAAARRIARRTVLDIQALTRDGQALPEVRAKAAAQIGKLAQPGKSRSASAEQREWWDLLRRDLRDADTEGGKGAAPFVDTLPRVPPGMPIGG
jgi:hypothetical protein